MIDLWFSSWNDCLATLPAYCDPAPIQAARSGAAFDAAAEQIENWMASGTSFQGVDTRRLDAVESVTMVGQSASAVVCVSDRAGFTTGDGRVTEPAYEASRYQLGLEVIDGNWKVVASNIVATSLIEGEALCVAA